MIVLLVWVVLVLVLAWPCFAGNKAAIVFLLFCTAAGILWLAANGVALTGGAL